MKEEKQNDINRKTGGLIMNVRKIKNVELMETRNISSLCFNWSHDTKGETAQSYFEREMSKPFTMHNAYWENTWASFTETDEMMGCLSILDYQVEFDGAPYKMAGIGGVCTYPQFRRKGAIREIFKKSLPSMYQEGYVFSYLYAFSEEFYRRFGYEPSCHARAWQFSMNTIPSTTYNGTFALYRGDEDLPSFSVAYEQYAKSLNLCVHRCQYDWDHLRLANPFKENKSAYLYRDETGKPAGYVIIEKVNEKDGRILHCSELVYDNFTTLKAIFSFIKTFQAAFDTFRLRAPGIIDLRYFCKDYSQSNSSIEIQQNGMVRVVNVKKVLEGARYKGSGKVSLRIRDSIIAENNKDYHLAFSKGQCQELDILPINEENTVDLILTINQFSAAIVGNYNVTDFMYMDLEQPCRNVEEIEKIFFRKPCWINNSF